MQTKYMRVVADIKYIKTYKKEHLISAFAKVNFSIENTIYKLRRKNSLLSLIVR